MRSTVSMTLASACLVMISSTDGSLLNQPADRLLRTLGRIEATVDRRITVPFDRLHDQRIVFAGGAQLIVDADGDGALAAVEAADRADGVGIGDRRADVLQAHAHGGDARRIDAHADRRLLGAGHGDVGDAVHLGEPLRDHAVGGVVDLARQHAFWR